MTADITQLYRKSARLEAPIVQEFMACARENLPIDNWLERYLNDETHEQYLFVLKKLKQQVRDDGLDPADPECRCELSSGEGEIEGVAYNNYTAIRFIYPQNREYCIFFCMDDKFNVIQVCGVLDQNLTWIKPDPLN